MKNSKAYRQWQRDMDYLAIAYDISSRIAENKPADVFSQVLKAALFVPEEMHKMYGEKMLKSMEYFLKTTVASLIKLQSLLKLSLNLNLISLSDYHALSWKMHEIGEIIAKFIKKVNSHFMDENEILRLEQEQDAVWALN